MLVEKNVDVKYCRKTKVINNLKKIENLIIYSYSGFKGRNGYNSIATLW